MINMPLSTTATYEYTTTNIPAFLSKLWTLVEVEDNNELIAWDQSGFSFHVYDQTRFAREILPKFFKHNNMASFIRQLNMYGFRKVNSIDHGSLRNEKEDMEFHHPFFIKGKEQFLEHIKRKVPETKQLNHPQNNALNYTNQQNMLQHSSQQQPQQQQQLTTHSSNNLTNGMSIQQLQTYPQIKQDEINRVLDDVSAIKSKQKMFDDSLFTVKKENEALWKEVASLRQKHLHQQQIVNKLIHFLVHLVNPSSMSSLKRTKPLMIDSHTAASFIDGQSSYSGIDMNNNALIDENLDHFIINSNEGANGIGRRSLVELEEENSKDLITDELSEGVLSPSYINNNIGVISKNDLYNACNASDDTEIETINNAKNVSPSTTVVPRSNYASNNNTNLKPLVKRLKTNDIQFVNNANTTKNLMKNIQNYQLVNNHNNNNTNNTNNNSKALVLNNHHHMNHLTNSINFTNNQIQEVLDSDLFINNNNSNTNNNGNAGSNNNSNDNSRLIDSIGLIDTTTSPSASLNNNLVTESPIVSMPTSPSLNSSNLNRNIMMINEVNNSNNSNNSQQKNDLVANIEKNENTIVSADNNSLRRAISNVNNSNSNQMNEHIESLQIDLNSIKEYLTNSTYNQPDTYNAINNLFSNKFLDQIDNDPAYLEASTQQPPVISQPSSNDLIQNEITNSMISDSLNQNTNDKVIGNELIQYEPMMQASDLFMSDDLFSESFENRVKNSLKPKVMNLQKIRLPVTQKAQVASPARSVENELNTPSIYIDNTASEKGKFKWNLN